jgi:putative transposase
MLSFKWRHFKKDIILMAVRWYVAYSLSYRDIEELMAERGVEVDHSTLNRWVVKYAPELEAEFRRKHKKQVGTSWRMDETYVKIKGVWHYLYRAVDKSGNTVDFMLSKKRDKKAAKRFFAKAIGTQGLPEKITIDKSGSNKSALKSINLFLALCSLMIGFPLKIFIRDVKYLNNVVEQDHRGIKRIIKPMMGFKSFKSAEDTLAGIELHRMLRKGQHKNASNVTIFEQFYALAG